MKKGSKTDWKRLNEMGDEAIDTSDIPELDEEFFQQAKIMCAQVIFIPFNPQNEQS